MIYRQVGNGLTFLASYTILFWALNLEDDNEDYRPDGFIKYERRADHSVLISYRQGVFNLKGLVDVGLPRTSLSVGKLDREYLNSELHMNLVYTYLGHRITGMYHFCHRYQSGDSNPLMLFLGKDNRVEVAIPVKWGREMSRFIRDSEKRRLDNIDG